MQLRSSEDSPEGCCLLRARGTLSQSGRGQDAAPACLFPHSPVGTESGDRGRERVGEGVPTTRLLRFPLRQLSGEVGTGSGAGPDLWAQRTACPGQSTHMASSGVGREARCDHCHSGPSWAAAWPLAQSWRPGVAIFDKYYLVLRLLWLLSVDPAHGQEPLAGLRSLLCSLSHPHTFACAMPTARSSGK